MLKWLERQKVALDHLGWMRMDADGCGWMRMDADGCGWMRMDGDASRIKKNFSKSSDDLSKAFSAVIKRICVRVTYLNHLKQSYLVE